MLGMGRLNQDPSRAVETSQGRNKSTLRQRALLAAGWWGRPDSVRFQEKRFKRKSEECQDGKDMKIRFSAAAEKTAQNPDTPLAVVVLPRLRLSKDTV